MKFHVNKTARAMKGKRFVAQQRGMSGVKGRGTSGHSSVKAWPTDSPKLPQATSRVEVVTSLCLTKAATLGNCKSSVNGCNDLTCRDIDQREYSLPNLDKIYSLTILATTIFSRKLSTVICILTQLFQDIGFARGLVH